MQTNPFFSALDKKAFAAIVGAFENCTYANGDTIIKEGDFKASDVTDDVTGNFTDDATF